ncbi:class I SAM-dependent methyltransferase [Streptomyces sp. NPDC021622]|uniref:class I SAM-dependent methyltransferase n=1 Tax=Streptomyces sp. NPDC021622 TaxID=3155013 RepID=UPI0033D70CF5
MADLASQPHSHAHSSAPHGTGPHSHAHAHGEDGAGPQPQHSLAEILDLDAALFASYLTAVTGRVACLAAGDVTHIVDLGAGTGTGTFALLDQFPTARVTAVDSSAEMLAGLTEAARARGLGDRVHTLRADAGAGLPGVMDADLVWASASLHHLDDPAAALAGIRTALRPGGLLAVAELDGIPRFLPADAVPDRPGLEARCREALDALHAERVPHLGADWGALLTAAGLTVEQERTEQLELRAPLPDGAGRYAYLALGGIRGALEGRIDPADLAAFDTLLGGGPQDVRHRDDLVVRSTRQLWVARRPGQ